MWLRAVWVVGVVLTVALICHGRILGVFQGQIVSEPYVHKNGKWLTVQSRNGFVRKVEISHAHVDYDDDFPANARRVKAEESLVQTAEVRITAERTNSGKGDGDWQATDILILNPKTLGTDRTAGVHNTGVQVAGVVW